MTGKTLLRWGALLLSLLVAVMVIGACSERAALNKYYSPGDGGASMAAFPGNPSPSSLASEQDELWIVPKDSENSPRSNVSQRGAGGGRGGSAAMQKPAPDAMPIPGSPILAARQSDGQLVPVPLKHTDVTHPRCP